MTARAELRVTQGQVVTAEWIKLRSLRSASGTLAGSVAAVLGIGVLLAWIALLHLNSGHDLGTVAPASISLYGVYLAQLTIGALGVMLFTGEYSTGMIRATLAAVPARLPVLWAKLGVFAAVALAALEAALFLSFLAGQAILAQHHSGASLSDPGALRAVIGAGLYLTLVGMLGIALGCIIRSTAGGIVTLFGLLLVLPVLVSILPSGWSRHVSPYLPSTAGQAIMQIHPASGILPPWNGFAVFAGYTAVAIATAAFLLQRRDA
jgi:ABC-2 type transport system permease protein